MGIQREASGFEFAPERRGEHSVRIREAHGERYLDATMQEGGRIVYNAQGEFTGPMLGAAKRKAIAMLKDWQKRAEEPVEVPKKIAS